MQVISRLYFALLVFFYLPEPDVTNLNQYFLVHICVVVWCNTELIRFCFYTFKGLGEGPLGHLRYNMFLINQPLGLFTEFIVLWESMFYVFTMPITERPWTILMPNSLNFEFRYEWGIFIAYVCFLPGAPFIFAS